VLGTSAVADISPFWESVYGEETPSEKVFGARAAASRPENAVQKRSSGSWHPSLDAIEYHSVAGLASKGGGAEVAADKAPASGPWREMQRLVDGAWLDAHEAQESPKIVTKTTFLRPSHVEAAVQASSVVRKGAANAVASSWHDFAVSTEPFQDEGVKDALLTERMGQTVEEMKSEAAVDAPSAQAARESAALEHREAVLELGKLRQAMRKVKPALLQIPIADETIEMHREDDVAARVAQEEADLHRFSYVDSIKGHRTVPVHALAAAKVRATKADYPMDPSPALPRGEAHASAQDHAHAHASAGAHVGLEASVDEEAAADEADHTEVHFKSASERAGRVARRQREEPLDHAPHKSGSGRAATWAACAIAGLSVAISAAA